MGSGPVHCKATSRRSYGAATWPSLSETLALALEQSLHLG
jgi:hypothetical protein